MNDDDKPAALKAPGETPSVERTQALLQVVIEAMPNAVVLVGERGIIEIANSRAARLFGYDSDGLAGLNIESLMPERFRSGHVSAHAAFMKQPGTREMGAGRELFGRRKDGSELPIEVGLDVLRTPQATFVLASIYDATERREAVRTAADATALAQSIIDSAPFAIVATDIDGVVLEVSPAAERMLGRSKSQLVGRRSPALLHDAFDAEHRTIQLCAAEAAVCPADLIAKINTGQTDNREWTLCRDDGTRLPIDLAMSGLRHRDGRLAGYIGIANDISARKRSEADMRHMAEHDALTGLPNRSLLHDRLEVSIARARRAQTRVGVLLIDLDHFKLVNDSLGHHVGDRLLVAVSRRLMRILRNCDTVARMGGDEFVVVLPDLQTRHQAEDIAGKIVEQLSVPMTIDGHAIPVTSSIGVCTFPDDGEGPDQLLMNADTAMYAAKESGRRRYLPFTPQMAAAVAQRWTMEHALRQALDAQDFVLHYQPQVCLETRRVIGVEALLRWPQGADRFVEPDHFIPIAEQTGLIMPLGEWALRRACAEMGNIRQLLPDDFRLAVNLSPRQLRLAGLPGLVADSLLRGGLRPDELELEITEGALLQGDIAETIAQLRATGVRIAIDDFGTGFSSLSHITRFPIDCLKIDRSFVRGIGSDASQAAVTAAIIAMGQQLQIAIVAEGIETQHQLEALREQGCRRGQGYMYSKAVPVADLVETVRRIMEAPVGTD